MFLSTDGDDLSVLLLLLLFMLLTLTMVFMIVDVDDEADVFDPKKLEIIEKEVNEMLKQAIEAHDADMEAFVNKDARTKLENYCYKCRRTLREQFSTDTAKIQLVNDYTSQTLAWINDNPELTKTQYLSKLHEFHAWFQQIKQ